jgi:NAD(P)H-hydrate epimerase
LTLVEQDRIENLLAATHRSPSAHKNDVGNVLIIAGGRGKTGAAGLTAESTLRAGVGLVTLATPQSCQPILASSAALEIMTEPLDETIDGTVSAAALKPALKLAEKKSLIAIGPGLGVNEESRKFLYALVEQRPCPLVIDADGLNSLSPWPEGLQGSSEKPLILTPHPGEMARLTGGKSADVASARIDLARKFATTNQVILVLKGERTVIAAPDGEVFINPTGNAGMATAGAGDVLTGIIAGLLGQAPTRALECAIAGVYLHGLAGDLAAKALGQRSLIASDLIKQLPAAILAVGGEIEKRNISDPLSRRNF